MKRYYFVSYIFSNENGLGIGSCFHTTDEKGINIQRCRNDLGLSNVTILNFIEIDKEEFLHNTEENK